MLKRNDYWLPSIIRIRNVSIVIFIYFICFAERLLPYKELYFLCAITYLIIPFIYLICRYNVLVASQPVREIHTEVLKHPESWNIIVSYVYLLKSNIMKILTFQLLFLYFITPYYWENFKPKYD